jgi:hypothetical protein
VKALAREFERRKKSFFDPLQLLELREFSSWSRPRFYTHVKKIQYKCCNTVVFNCKSLAMAKRKLVDIGEINHKELAEIRKNWIGNAPRLSVTWLSRFAIGHGLPLLKQELLDKKFIKK